MSKITNKMHITTVLVCGYNVEYSVKSINGEPVVVAEFMQNSEIIHREYNITSMSHNGAGMVAILYNNIDYAKSKALQIIEQSKKSKHSPFYK